jgi:hypothetical protein
VRISYVVSGGQGVIDIGSDGFASCLNTSWASALDWPDCGGSVARYYALSEYAPNERRALGRALDDALAAGDELRIEHSLPEFLQLFSDGAYSVRTQNVGREYESYHVTEQEYYPSGCYGLALTQSIEMPRSRAGHSLRCVDSGWRATEDPLLRKVVH